MKRHYSLWTGFLISLFIIACSEQPSLKIDFEKYTLDNGLEVILHEDRSDPIVSVAVLYHVGSNREERGRTGFAHLFEHVLFQESQHVGQDQFFKKIQDAGGTLNGGTFEDGTVYYEVVPKNALEMVLWLEADRTGWLLSTVNQAAFENQQDVVQNEKRQRVDNRPYGHTNYVIHKNLYPEDHPYNWQVIGSFEDLKNATIEDVRNFYTRWYGPNNATLVIAGDFDVAETKQLVEKYFGEIKSGPAVEDPEIRHVVLSETKRVFHEDNFDKSPELTLVWPTRQFYDEDVYALDLLADLLAEGKKAPLYKVIVEEKKLAPSVRAQQNTMEVTGDFRIRIRAFPNKNLADVEEAIHEAFARFEEEGFTEKDLERIKAKTETDFYNGISSILSKSFQLAFYNVYAGTPAYITEDLTRYLAVTKEDINRVYMTYLKGKPHVLTSFVPKDEPSLVAAGSERYPVVEEEIEASEKRATADNADIAIEEIPSSFDRNVEPAKGEPPVLRIPAVWEKEYANRLRIYGIEHDELPLVQFSVTLKGGLLLDARDRVGVANLMSDIMMEGTKNRTPVELEEAIDELGADIRMSTDEESISIRANCLATKFEQVYALVEEILLEPRWDEKEFERLKRETIENIHRRDTQPNAIASKVFNKLLYGSDHILANTTLGTEESVAHLTIDDLKQYYEKNFSPTVAHVAFVGAIKQDKVVATFASLENKWPAKEVEIAAYPIPPSQKSQIYFVDVPNAKQSEIRIGHLALPYKDPDFYAAEVMNYKLGGSFNGNLNLILREEKGFTYGARSRFDGSDYPGPFVASAGVKSNTTFESMQIFQEEISKYRTGIAEEDLAFTKNALIKSNARRFETLGALMGMLHEIAQYDLPVDYIKQQETIIENMTEERHQELAQKYIRPDSMIYLVVGDAKTQLPPLRQFGLGRPILLDTEGNPVSEAMTAK